MGNQSARLSLKLLETAQDLRMAKAILDERVSGRWKSCSENRARAGSFHQLHYRVERTGYERERDQVGGFKVSIFSLTEK